MVYQILGQSVTLNVLRCNDLFNTFNDEKLEILKIRGFLFHIYSMKYFYLEDSVQFHQR